MRVAVLGAGGWGTALARMLARRGHPVALWARNPDFARKLATERENRRYLPGASLPPGLEPTSGLEAALAGADLVVVAVPVQCVREALGRAKEHLPSGAARLILSKGLERSSGLRVSEVLREIWGPGPVSALSGPSFASEVAAEVSTSVAVGTADPSLGGELRRCLGSDWFHVDLTDDLAGVELGGALKNVIALAAGMVRGLDLGANALAALLTRGMGEMVALAVALGARAETLLGLAGLGDLVLTATGTLSRNERVGEAIVRARAAGRKAPPGPAPLAEGVETAAAAARLAAARGVAAPILGAVNSIIHESADPRATVVALLRREPAGRRGDPGPIPLREPA